MNTKQRFFVLWYFAILSAWAGVISYFKLPRGSLGLTFTFLFAMLYTLFGLNAMKLKGDKNVPRKQLQEKNNIPA